MGKTMNYLQQQLKDPDTKKDAEDCIRIYEKILEMNDGHVWASAFVTLCRVVGYVGQSPNSRTVYKPTPIGYIFLKGLDSKKHVSEQLNIPHAVNSVYCDCDNPTEYTDANGKTYCKWCGKDFSENQQTL